MHTWDHTHLKEVLLVQKRGVFFLNDVHSGSFGCLLPRSLLGQNEIASLLFYIPSLYHSSIEKHTHTRARQLSENMPAITCVFSLRDGSLFFSISPAIRNAFLDFDRLFFFSALVRRKKLFFFVFFFFAFVREKKKKKTEKRRRNLDLRHRFSLVQVPSLRVCCPSVVYRSAQGKFPFLSKF